MLHNEYTKHSAVVNHRHAQEGFEFFFFRFGNVDIARVIARLFEVHRFRTLRDKTNKAFFRRQTGLANGTGVQALGGHQHVAAQILVEEIDGTDARAHRVLHALNTCSIGIDLEGSMPSKASGT